MKPRFLRSLTFSTALMLGLVTSVNAAEFSSLDTQASTISFGYKQMGVGMDGGFDKFNINEFSFNPDSPESAKVSIDITLESIDAGYADANQELVKKEWLDMAQYPLASFQSNKVEALGNNQFQVTGVLSIKGHDQEISAPVTFSEDGENGIFEGSFTFLRNDFAIGEGSWSDTSIVADDIEVKFHLIAKQ